MGKQRFYNFVRKDVVEQDGLLYWCPPLLSIQEVKDILKNGRTHKGRATRIKTRRVNMVKKILLLETHVIWRILAYTDKTSLEMWTALQVLYTTIPLVALQRDTAAFMGNIRLAATMSGTLNSMLYTAIYIEAELIRRGDLPMPAVFVTPEAELELAKIPSDSTVVSGKKYQTWPIIYTTPITV
jgi:hypothetical protein